MQLGIFLTNPIVFWIMERLFWFNFNDNDVNNQFGDTRKYFNSETEFEESKWAQTSWVLSMDYFKGTDIS